MSTLIPMHIMNSEKLLMLSMAMNLYTILLTNITLTAVKITGAAKVITICFPAERLISPWVRPIFSIMRNASLSSKLLPPTVADG